MINLNKSNNCSQGLSSWNYSIISEKSYDTDLGEYNTYGVKVEGSNYTKILHDISTCEETVINMVEIFNQHQLSPIHFQNVIEDMLF